MVAYSDFQKLYLLCTFVNSRYSIEFEKISAAPPTTIASYNGCSFNAFDLQKRIEIEQVLLLKQFKKLLDIYTQMGYDALHTARVVMQQPTYYKQWSEILSVTQLGNRVWEDMKDDLLISSEAEKWSIHITPDMAKNESDADIISAIKDTQLNEADTLYYLESRRFRHLLQEAIGAELPRQMLFANCRHIMLSSEMEAVKIRNELLQGIPFNQLAILHSKDTLSGSMGGELGKEPVFKYVREFADAVKNALIGDIMGPVRTDFGFHIIQVLEKEFRDADEHWFNLAKELEYQHWLKETKARETANIAVEVNWGKYLQSKFKIPRDIENELKQFGSAFDDLSI